MHGIGRSEVQSESPIEMGALSRPSTHQSEGADSFSSLMDLYQHGHEGAHSNHAAEHGAPADGDSTISSLLDQNGHGHAAPEQGGHSDIDSILDLYGHDHEAGHGHEGGQSIGSNEGAGHDDAASHHSGSAEEAHNSPLTEVADMLRKIATAGGTGMGAIGTGLGTLAPAGSTASDAGHDLGVAGSALGVLGSLGKLGVDAKKGELSLSNNWTDVASLLGNATNLGFNAYKVSEQDASSNPPAAPPPSQS